MVVEQIIAQLTGSSEFLLADLLFVRQLVRASRLDLREHRPTAKGASRSRDSWQLSPRGDCVTARLYPVVSSGKVTVSRPLNRARRGGLVEPLPIFRSKLNRALS